MYSIPNVQHHHHPFKFERWRKKRGLLQLNERMIVSPFAIGSERNGSGAGSLCVHAKVMGREGGMAGLVNASEGGATTIVQYSTVQSAVGKSG